MFVNAMTNCVASLVLPFANVIFLCEYEVYKFLIYPKNFTPILFINTVDIV
jgi:hypothetical protein